MYWKDIYSRFCLLVSILALSVIANAMPPLPKREVLAPPLGKISPGRGKMAKPKRGTAGASAPERASPTEEKEKHSDTRTLTNRVSIAVSSRWSCSSYNLSVSHSLDSRSPFGTCVPPPPAGGVFPSRGGFGIPSRFPANANQFHRKRNLFAKGSPARRAVERMRD